MLSWNGAERWVLTPSCSGLNVLCLKSNVVFMSELSPLIFCIILQDNVKQQLLFYFAHFLWHQTPILLMTRMLRIAPDTPRSQHDNVDKSHNGCILCNSSHNTLRHNWHMRMHIFNVNCKLRNLIGHIKTDVVKFVSHWISCLSTIQPIFLKPSLCHSNAELVCI